jgi:hypothetical protein
VAHEIGALNKAGLAALTLIEEIDDLTLACWLPLFASERMADELSKPATPTEVQSCWRKASRPDTTWIMQRRIQGMLATKHRHK